MTTHSKNFEKQRIISHCYESEAIEQTVERIKARIIKHGNKPHVTVERQLQIVEEMANCPYGQFLLKNRGLDGYWADYMMIHPKTGRITGTDPQGRRFTNVEKILFDKCPSFLATQQRAICFANIIQRYVKENAVFASLPCGFLRDLLWLDYKDIKNFRLVGIDIDEKMLVGAKQLAEEHGLSAHVELCQEDAWNLPFQECFTLLTSNGLNIYEPDDEKVTELYCQFFKALAPGGVLLTSFLTPPPDILANSERDTNNINQEDMLLETIIFADVLESKWRCFRSSSTTLSQLEAAGFKEIEFIYDKARIFPTVIAHKPK
jgi:SAM-dependent methyltransferase